MRFEQTQRWESVQSTFHRRKLDEEDDLVAGELDESYGMLCLASDKGRLPL